MTDSVRRPTRSNLLAKKLQTFADLDAEDCRALDELARGGVGRRAGSTLIREGDRPESVFLLLEGWAYRYKVVQNGGRQIMAYLIPGDLCDPHVFILRSMDHTIGLLSDAVVKAIPKQEIIDVTRQRPAIAQALWWSVLVDEGTLRHWLVNLGRRSAFDRMAHLFCELWERMGQVGLTHGSSFRLPLTQEQLGDTMGMTKVHVNRVLQRMRGAGLITLEDKCLTIHSMDALRNVADFDSEYLHLKRRL